ncbi:winged helix-turn-helix domain-containing protein [Nocardiopsis sp. NPDC050513]|uniref:winged helix-turn-helix domain-containing protein n=1 Tax=Nocardiopsis sp. NPDC050513 TaxID=3364338 RepID=UPI00379A20B8
MILTDRIAHGVAAGEVTTAYRRWRHPRVRPGSTFLTVAGIVRVDAIEPAAGPDQIDANAARTAGYATRDDLAATLHGDDTDPLWRITLSWAGPDPREALAQNAALSPSDIADIDALLDRLDVHTPWARTTLDRLARHPGTTAAQLAAELPIDKDSLKRRIRRLREHGLTRSLPSGYELSARGHAYLATALSDDPLPR